MLGDFDNLVNQIGRGDVDAVQSQVTVGLALIGLGFIQMGPIGKTSQVHQECVPDPYSTCC